MKSSSHPGSPLIVRIGVVVFTVGLAAVYVAGRQREAALPRLSSASQAEDAAASISLSQRVGIESEPTPADAVAPPAVPLDRTLPEIFMSSSKSGPVDLLVRGDGMGRVSFEPGRVRKPETSAAKTETPTPRFEVMSSSKSGPISFSTVDTTLPLNTVRFSGAVESIVGPFLPKPGVVADVSDSPNSTPPDRNQPPVFPAGPAVLPSPVVLPKPEPASGENP